MKRNQGLFLIVLVGAGLFLWRGFGHSVSSTEESASSSLSRQSSNENHGEASQSSSAPEERAQTESSAPSAVANEPVLFQDNPARVRISPNRGGAGAVAFVAPTSLESLRASSLWAGQDWKVWKGVSAVPKVSYQGSEGKELGSVGSFVVVENSNSVSDENHFYSQAPLAVFNPTRNRTGIVTGDISVTLQDAGDFESFVLDHDLKIKEVFPHLRLYYVAAGKEPVDLVALLTSLKNDPRVEKVNLEIVTQSYAKK
ncbi:hypothetical protein [Bdellovibrio svalbardensis]|uniref:ASP external chaperone domain-containing protein n=1 Tax=Bdellovibrio svalbardensis TaxID=2972972 RepID=A0ABT6DGN4_9BACT|nr:hypothetical protein [Bdellovibrio svalbardensis]MDG0816000.1 hypothetical protein [Bdellovibrio svalbardensis]